jgi:hypothetical protein
MFKLATRLRKGAQRKDNDDGKSAQVSHQAYTAKESRVSL